MTTTRRTIAWLRGDLRVDDNPALAAAHERGTDGCTAVHLLDEAFWSKHHWGPARRGMTLRAVAAMRPRLADAGIDLRVLSTASSSAEDVITEACRVSGATEVHANREFGVDENRRDDAVANRLANANVAFERHHDQTILPVEEIRSGAGTPYTVFTPFKRKWLALLTDAGIPAPLSPPHGSGVVPKTTDAFPGEITLEAALADAPESAFEAGEAEPLRRLDAFLDGPVQRYHDDRDPPSLDGTSTLSPWLACGSISPRRILRKLVDRFGEDPATWQEGPSTWLSELIWREFYRHVMDGIPKLSMDRPLHGWTDRVQWRDDDAGFAAWCEGRTGIAIVDAGMRQLAATGWMHNRVRMITATFLAKHLLIDWRRGERFFMKQLVDGDFPSNNGGWQWAASTGTDAAPYFRIFNPDRQAERFDAAGTYIRRWVPEYDGPASMKPIVDLKAARVRAIETFKSAKNAVTA